MSLRSPKYSQLERMDATLKRFGDAHQRFRDSNPTPAEVRRQDIRVIVAEPGWQEIRHSFVGTWKDPNKIKTNVKRLSDWLGDGSDPIRVRQILNYVTGSGFRIGIISDPIIERFRDQVRVIWKGLLGE